VCGGACSTTVYAVLMAPEAVRNTRPHRHSLASDLSAAPAHFPSVADLLPAVFACIDTIPSPTAILWRRSPEHQCARSPGCSESESVCISCILSLSLLHCSVSETLFQFTNVYTYTLFLHRREGKSSQMLSESSGQRRSAAGRRVCCRYCSLPVATGATLRKRAGYLWERLCHFTNN
jgi:hypothetical protein